MNTTILHAEVAFFNRPLLTPLQLSSGPILELTEARATVTVRAAGREAVGRGAIYLSDLWSWPDPALSHTARDAALRAFCETLAARLNAHCGGEALHPLELGLRLHHTACRLPFAHRQLDPPLLARALCASPFDAALHDAVGLALDRSAFDFYDTPRPIPSADHYFPGLGACAAIARALTPFRPTLDAWWIVCPADALPDYVAPAVRRTGIRCFKLKTKGKDNAADVARTVDVFRAVRAMGLAAPRLSVDSNEANPDAAGVADYLERLRAADQDAFQAVAYLEQPTPRDIRAHAFDWRPVTRLKPVLLDEGLTDLERMAEAVDQGWSGFALKTCKGHSFALTVAAWAHARQLPLALQDLTNPGLAAIHAALVAARLPTLNGVELNSPQYTPAANAEWLPRLRGLFEPTDGVHRLDALAGAAGLGSRV